MGIIGANPDRGWAARAHIPAIQASPDFALTAVATTRRESAEAARGRFGARHAFTDPASLAAHPDVDLVVVTVKVPAHVELVRAALDGGKHVYCEWPLTPTAAEAADLAEAARRAGVHAVVGPQARYAPAVDRARHLIADGRIGTVLSATLYSSRSILAAMELTSGAVASVHLHDAEAAFPRTRLEIAGTAGDLALVSVAESDPWAAQLQIGRMALHLSRPGEPGWQEVPTGGVGNGLPTSAANVARLYAQLATDLRDGPRTAPDFSTALAVHRLVEQIP